MTQWEEYLLLFPHVLCISLFSFWKFAKQPYCECDAYNAIELWHQWHLMPTRKKKKMGRVRTEKAWSISLYISSKCKNLILNKDRHLSSVYLFQNSSYNSVRVEKLALKGKKETKEPSWHHTFLSCKLKNDGQKFTDVVLAHEN